MKNRVTKFIALALVLVTAFSVHGLALSVGATVTPSTDPIPENIGILKTNNGVKISYTRRFDDENGAIPVGAGVGAHGGHETRIVRTENGTYATFITDATGSATTAHPNWVNGVAKFYGGK